MSLTDSSGEEPVAARDSSSEPGPTQPLEQENLSLRRQLAALRAERDLLTFIVNSIPDYVGYVDRDLVYRVCNETYASESGRPLDTFVGKHVIEFVGEAGMAKIQPHVDRVLQGELVDYEDRVDYRFKTQQDVEVQYAPHRTAVGEVKGFSVYVRNITARRRAEETLHRQARHDPLTDLPNRTLFSECLCRAISRSERMGGRLAVLFIDLDGFKRVNDLLGHESGDEVLRDVSIALQDALRNNDTVARMGGDEFVVLTEDLEEEAPVKKVAEKIIRCIANLATPRLGNIRIGASIGISYYPDHGQDPKELLIRADAAMYESKRRGRCRYCVFGGDPIEVC